MPDIRRAGRLALAFDVLKQAVRACPPEILPMRKVTEPAFKTEILYRSKASEVRDKLQFILDLQQQLLDTAAPFYGGGRSSPGGVGQAVFSGTDCFRSRPKEPGGQKGGRKFPLLLSSLPMIPTPPCPCKEQCPVKIQKKKALLKINQKSLLAAEIRKELADPEFWREATSKRAAIEGTISAIKRGRGASKLSVRGQIKCTLVMGFQTIAHNFQQLKKFFALKEKEEKAAKIKIPSLQGVIVPI